MKGGNSGQNSVHYGNTPGKKLVKPAVWAIIRPTHV